MRIIITKFRYYEDSVEYEFTEGELNLILGPSNSGKSTIFRAIAWCLYGNKKTVNPKGIKTTNKEPTIVQIILDSGVTITRTKPPDKLVILLEDETELSEDSANEWINTYFGSENAFYATTYMKQKKENPILELSNAKKMILIREITFGKNLDDKTIEDPDYYTEKINSEIKETKDEILRINGRISILEEQYLISKDENKKNLKIWSKKDLELNIETLNDLKKQLKEKQEINDKSKNKLANLRKEWQTYTSNKKQKEYLLQQKEIIKKQLNEINYDVKTLTFHIENLNIKLQYEKQTIANEKNKPDQKICDFLNKHSSNLEKITSFLYEIKQFHSQLQSLKCDTNISKLEIENKIQNIKNKLLIIEEQKIKKQKYELELSQYETIKKQWKQWDEKRKKNEKAKMLYDEFYSNPDLIAIKNILNLNEEDSSIKDILKKYYTKTDRFNSIIQILQKILYDITISETLLTCPKSSANLEIFTSKNKTCLIENKSLDTRNINCNKKLVENSIKAIQKLDYLLSEYQLHKDLDEEPKIPQLNKYEEDFYDSENENNLKKQLKKYENLNYCNIQQLNELLNENYSIEEYENFIEENSNYILYQKGLTNIKKYSDWKIIIDNLDLKQSQQILNNINTFSAQLKSVNTELESFVDLEEPEYNISEFENIISENEEKIQKNINLIDIANKLLKLEKLQLDLKNQQNNLEVLTQRHINLDKIKQIIAQTGSHAMEETIETINAILQDISLAIYNNDTIITMSMFKEFKTKDYLKPQPTITVTRGYGEDQEQYDFEDELCGGEQSRVSLALTLAFATVSTTPFLFIDEGLSSMDSVLVDRCMKIVKKYASNKTIINVCHNISEGIHDNIITIVNNDF